MEYDDLYEVCKVVSELHKSVLELKLTDKDRLRYLERYYSDLQYWGDRLRETGLYKEELGKVAEEWRPIFEEIQELKYKGDAIWRQQNPRLAEQYDEEFRKRGFKDEWLPGCKKPKEGKD